MSDAAYFTHVCEGGERWDTLAHVYYGNALRLAPILRANPDLVGREGGAPLIFTKGTEVRVPVLEDEGALGVPLPPWRRPE